MKKKSKLHEDFLKLCKKHNLTRVALLNSTEDEKSKDYKLTTIVNLDGVSVKETKAFGNALSRLIALSEFETSRLVEIAEIFCEAKVKQTIFETERQILKVKMLIAEEKLSEADKKKLSKIRANKHSAVDKQDYEKAVKFREQERAFLGV